MKLLFFTLTFIIIPRRCYAITSCVKKSACSCQGDKGMVDLSPLAKSGGAMFMDQQGNDGSKYSWNPCKSFTESKCVNVAACQNQGGTNQFSLGTQDSAKFEVKNGHLTLSYNADTNFPRTSVITLTCDMTTEASLIVTGEVPGQAGTYLMTLISKHACEKTSGGGGGTGGAGLTIGSILCIVAFVLVIVYVIGGISVQKFVRRAEGKEMVPNYTFWTGFPGLVRDGVLFTVRCGKSGSKYDQI